MRIRTAITGAASALLVSFSSVSDVFGQTFGLAPTDPKSQIAKAETLMEERKPSEALAILENMLSEHPEFPDIRYKTALAAQRSGDSQRARALAKEAIQRNEESAPLFVLLGVVAMQEKNNSDALRYFEQATRLDPKDAIALYNLSEALREEGRATEAIDILQRAVDIEPDRSLLQLKLRLAQLEAGVDVDELKLEVLKRQGEEDQTEDWHMTAAAVHLNNGNFRQAGEAIRAAREIAGSNTIGPIFAEDHFFRQFAKDERLKEIREEFGLSR